MTLPTCTWKFNCVLKAEALYLGTSLFFFLEGDGSGKNIPRESNEVYCLTVILISDGVVRQLPEGISRHRGRMDQRKPLRKTVLLTPNKWEVHRQKGSRNCTFDLAHSLKVSAEQAGVQVHLRSSVFPQSE